MQHRRGHQILNIIPCKTHTTSFVNNTHIPLEQTINQPSYNPSEINLKSIQQVKTNTTSIFKNNFLNIAQKSNIIQGNPDLFQTKFWINASKDIPTIERVTYYLHPTFTPNVINSTTPNATNPENNFSIIITNWGKFNLKASVFFTNGKVAELELPIENWNPPK